MKLPIAFVLLALSAGVGRAEDNSAALYHVQQDTFGCANPTYTRTLTNPQEPRRGDRRWVRSAMDEGRCVTITPRSPWKLVSLEGDVALMSYAGDSGPPGAYYLNIADVVDGAGRHPGGGDPAALTESSTAPAAPPPVAPPQGDTTSATALAPPPASLVVQDHSLSPAPPATASFGWSAISWLLAIAGFAALAAILFWHTRRLNRIERTR